MFRHAEICISWSVDCVDMDRAAQRATDVMGLCKTRSGALVFYSLLRTAENLLGSPLTIDSSELLTDVHSPASLGSLTVPKICTLSTRCLPVRYTTCAGGAVPGRYKEMRS
jgi:hypothetical protein